MIDKSATDWESWEDLKTPTVESDDELRARLLYVAGDSQALFREIVQATGMQLDLIADRCRLKRHKL